MKYDLEKTITDIAAIIKAGINAKLLVIDAEKNDGITLTPFDSEAYFFESMNNKSANYGVFLWYGLNTSETLGIAGETAEKVEFVFIVVLIDSDQNDDTTKKMYRYQRALREVLQEGAFGLDGGNRMVISNMAPVDFSLLNSSRMHKAIGISVKTDIIF